MQENSVWLYIKVLGVLACLYIEAAVACCLSWPFATRHPASKPIARELNKEVLDKSGVHAESA